MEYCYRNIAGVQNRFQWSSTKYASSSIDTGLIIYGWLDRNRLYKILCLHVKFRIKILVVGLVVITIRLG
jgi:hypothetical protein